MGQRAMGLDAGNRDLPPPPTPLMPLCALVLPLCTVAARNRRWSRETRAADRTLHAGRVTMIKALGVGICVWFEFYTVWSDCMYEQLKLPHMQTGPATGTVELIRRAKPVWRRLQAIVV